MNDLLYLREQHGDVFVTTLSDGLRVPWKPLSIGEYLRYDNLRLTGQYPQAFLDDEIFRACVTDSTIVKDLDRLKAGTITTVVAAVMAVSGPSSIDELNLVLNASRYKVSTNVLHDMVNLITQAYPAYTIEEILSLDYEAFTFRFAQAERKLMSMGILQEPVNFELPNQEEATKKAPKSRPKIDSQELFNIYEKQGDRAGPIPASAGVEPAKSTKQQTIITKADIIEHESALVGHEKDVVHIEKEAADTAKIYEDYLKQRPKKDEKLVMKTTEERKADAEARMEANRLKNLQNTKLRQRLDKEEMKGLLEVRERERARKAKKQRRRK